MKKVVVALVGIVVIIGIVALVAFQATSGLAESAQAFFAAIKDNNHGKAYQSLSQEFRAGTSEKEFREFLEKSALTDFAEVSWSSRSMSGGRGELKGSVTTTKGGVVPLQLGFVKENDSWKIYSIQKPQAGLSQQESAESVPPADALVELVDESMRTFAESLNAGDFSAFHAHVSNLWRKQSSVEGFNEMFRVFLDADINMLPALQQHAPVFEQEPAIDGNGVLLLKGHYPTQPSRILFQLKYMYEGIGWRVVGIEVNIV